MRQGMIKQEQAVAALWLSETFKMSFCKLTLKLAVETVESWPAKEQSAGRQRVDS
jgi:hypothetical protein